MKMTVFSKVAGFGCFWELSSQTQKFSKIRI
jgi:hypothetical protein